MNKQDIIDKELEGQKVQIRKIGGISIFGEVLEAHKDLKGVIHRIKLRKMDGTFSWIDTGDSIVDILKFSSEWVEWIWINVQAWFIKKV